MNPVARGLLLMALWTGLALLGTEFIAVSLQGWRTARHGGMHDRLPSTAETPASATWIEIHAPNAPR